MSIKCYLVFNSTREVVIAEKECNNGGGKCLAVPIPREFSERCGIALEVDNDNIETAINIIERLGFKYKRLERDNK